MTCALITTDWTTKGMKEGDWTMYKRVMGVLLVLILVGQPAWACRPLATDDCGTVEVDAIEMEIGVDWVDNGNERNSAVNVTLTTGLTKRLDFAVAIPYEINESGEQGLSSAELGMKFVLVRNFISFTFGYILGSPGYTINSILSKSIGLTTIHFNLGFTSTGDVKEAVITSLGGAIEYPVLKRLILVGEVTAEASSTIVWEMLIGAYLPVSESLMIDFGVGRGLSKENNSMLKGTLGLTYAF